MYKLELLPKQQQPQKHKSKLIKRPKQQQHLKQEPPPDTAATLSQPQLQSAERAKKAKTLSATTTKHACKLDKVVKTSNNKRYLLYAVCLNKRRTSAFAYQQQLPAIRNSLHLIKHFLQRGRAHLLIANCDLRNFIDYT